MKVVSMGKKPARTVEELLVDLEKTLVSDLMDSVTTGEYSVEDFGPLLAYYQAVTLRNEQMLIKHDACWTEGDC